MTLLATVDRRPWPVYHTERPPRCTTRYTRVSVARVHLRSLILVACLSVTRVCVCTSAHRVPVLQCLPLPPQPRQGTELSVCRSVCLSVSRTVGKLSRFTLASAYFCTNRSYDADHLFNSFVSGMYAACRGGTVVDKRRPRQSVPCTRHRRTARARLQAVRRHRQLSYRGYSSHRGNAHQSTVRQGNCWHCCSD